MLNELRRTGNVRSTAACVARLLLGFVMLAFASAGAAQRPLSFEERVACREKVENVYWSHRLWPPENSTPKPGRETVISRAAIAARVDDALRYETALDEIWRRPLSAADIQAEIDREARSTRDPAMLRELWRALDEDPYLVAECLIRPELAERRLKAWRANDPSLNDEIRARAQADLAMHPTLDALRSGFGTVQETRWVRNDDREPPTITSGAISLGDDEWRALTARLVTELGAGAPGAPTKSIDLARLPRRTVSALQEDEDGYHVVSLLGVSDGELRLATVTWLKEPFGEWWSKRRPTTARAAPGSSTYVLPSLTSTDCRDDTWQQSPGLTVPVPRARTEHTAVWTGSEMIIWGGRDPLTGDATFTGGRYIPATDSWVPTDVTSAPFSGTGHSAVWSGSEMIVWGGDGINGIGSGGRYSPATDHWTATSMSGAPTIRRGHNAVWTGQEMIVWGGFVPSASAAAIDGGRYSPATDSWTAMSNFPLVARTDASAVWTGSEMIVWGGQSSSFFYQSDGARYRPSTNTWLPMSNASAPDPRSRQGAVWSGSRMVVWGGVQLSGPIASGGRYDPVTDTWTGVSVTGAPSPRDHASFVWTGGQMIVWGGFVWYAGNTVLFNDGARYDPATDQWTPTSGVGAPTARWGHTAVWSGSEMIVWSGMGAAGYTASGGRYSPSLDRWVPTSTGGPLSPRASQTAVWTGSEMIVWGGTDGFTALGTGARYAPATDTWTSTAGTRAPSPRKGHTALWSGSQMVIWGGSGAAGELKTGARHAPATDAWSTIDTFGAPLERATHTAVWTGSQMLIWGGNSFGLPLNDGALYDPFSDVWHAISSTGAATPRYAHTAVWTGSEMIVWGGVDGNVASNLGGRYDLASDSWSSMSAVPDGRTGHSAVWTGAEMIIWGGSSWNGARSEGARYRPAGDVWLPMATAGAPAARYSHTAVWTGKEMIVWGGYGTMFRSVDTGGRYRPEGDVWQPTRLFRAPTPREKQSAVWTGSRMIVWGGQGVSYVNDGGQYCANAHGMDFYTVKPCRLFDSRSSLPFTSGTEVFIWSAGRCDVGADARAVAVNLIAVDPTTGGVLSAYPNQGQPTGTVVVSFSAGQTRASNTVMMLSDFGFFTVKPILMPGGTAHIVADVVGYFY